LLRTTDGVNWSAVPQIPGTFMGDLVETGLRTGVVYNGRMYLTNGTSRGEGTLIESANPAAGGDSFRAVLAPGTLVWDVMPYNDALYVGVIRQAGQSTFFEVAKTDASGSPPYPLTPVIPQGGYGPNPASQTVVSMAVFEDRLYVGTYNPASGGELYRINPDDTWDLVVGQPRATPNGRKEPLSGLEPGFGWPYNVQIYRMHEYNGILYLGTLDIARDVTETFPNLGLDDELSWHYGFDLYRTDDGVNFEATTITGFGDPFQIALRTFATTPHGLFMGAGSYWYGLRIWQQLPTLSTTFMPAVMVSGAAGAQAQPASTPVEPARATCPATGPRHLQADFSPTGVILSWDPQATGGQYRVLRAGSKPAPMPAEKGSAQSGAVLSPFVEVGTATGFYYVDQSAAPGEVYHYQVETYRMKTDEPLGRAPFGPGCPALRSNLVRIPSLAPDVSFASLQAGFTAWGDQPVLTTVHLLQEAEQLAAQSEPAKARERLSALRAGLQSGAYGEVPAWRLADLNTSLNTLDRRLLLQQAGVLSLALGSSTQPR
jgi:hypothetical protein